MQWRHADALEASRSAFDNRRLDVAGLEADDEVVVTVEAERVNNDLHTAAPKDYDTMAACEPEEAVWIAMSNDEAREILAALNDPPEGPVRVEKEYADTTKVADFSIDEPGCTEILTLHSLQRSLGAE